VLLDLDGLAVVEVERLGNGTRRVHLVTADEQARACPECGVFATRVKGSALTRPRDLPCGQRGLQLVWHKRRWYCREPACPRKSFTEQVGQVPAGARIMDPRAAARSSTTSLDHLRISVLCGDAHGAIPVLVRPRLPSIAGHHPQIDEGLRGPVTQAKVLENAYRPLVVTAT
jgi:hypothetical protein